MKKSTERLNTAFLNNWNTIKGLREPKKVFRYMKRLKRGEKQMQVKEFYWRTLNYLSFNRGKVTYTNEKMWKSATKNKFVKITPEQYNGKLIGYPWHKNCKLPNAS